MMTGDIPTPRTKDLPVWLWFAVGVVIAAIGVEAGVRGYEWLLAAVVILAGPAGAAGSRFFITHALPKFFEQYGSVVTENKKHPGLAVVANIALKGISQRIVVQRVLLIGMFLYLVSVAFFGVPLEIVMLLVPTCVLFILVLDEWLLTYRIQMGFYGTNDYEAREIIALIAKESRRN